jgi:hypothetical protein
MAATVTFDTLRYVEKLQKAGVSDQQARAEAGALSDAFCEAMDSQLAKRTDIERIERELSVLKWMAGFNLALTVTILWKLFGH